jgi:amidohydrolase
MAAMSRSLAPATTRSGLVLLALVSGQATGPAAAQAAAQVAPQEDPLLARIDARLTEAEAELIEIRRDLHRHPEVSGREERTAGVVADRLRALGLEVETGVGGHGVVGVLRGGQAGPVVAFRADMDAVPSGAPDPVEFSSENPGVRHICGHDIHTTVGLGIAEALSAVREDLPGTVKFIFQPSEENIQGARAMLEEGVLDYPAPTAIYAYHTAPLEVGQIGAIQGMGLTGFDIVTVTVSGDGDIETAAAAYAEVIAGIGTIGPPGSPNAAAPGMSEFIHVQSGRPVRNGSNYVFRAQVRATSEDLYLSAKSRIAEGIRELSFDGVDYQIDHRDRVLADMVNDDALVAASLDVIRSRIGEDGLLVSTTTTPYFGEDFAFFQQHIPGAMYWLGVSNSEKGIVGMPHSPGYVADEGAILVGARTMSAIMLDYLRTH